MTQNTAKRTLEKMLLRYGEAPLELYQKHPHRNRHKIRGMHKHNQSHIKYCNSKSYPVTITNSHSETHDHAATGQIREENTKRIRTRGVGRFH